LIGNLNHITCKSDNKKPWGSGEENSKDKFTQGITGQYDQKTERVERYWRESRHQKGHKRSFFKKFYNFGDHFSQMNFPEEAAIGHKLEDRIIERLNYQCADDGHYGNG